MGHLSRLDDAVANRWPRLFGHRFAPLSVAFVFIVVGVVCLVIGGTVHAVGVGASGAGIGLMITGIHRAGHTVPDQPSSNVQRPTAAPPRASSDMTELASSILRDEDPPSNQ